MEEPVQADTGAVAFLDAIRASELFVAADLLPAHAKINVPAFGVSGYGPKVFKRFLALVIQHFPDLTYVAGGRHEAAGEVMDFADVAGNQLGGAAPTGRELALGLILTVRYAEGAIREVEASFPPEPVYYAMGRSDTPPTPAEPAEPMAETAPEADAVAETPPDQPVEPTEPSATEPAEATEAAAADEAVEAIAPVGRKAPLRARLAAARAAKAAAVEEAKAELANPSVGSMQPASHDELTALLSPYAQGTSAATGAATGAETGAEAGAETGAVAKPGPPDPLATLTEPAQPADESEPEQPDSQVAETPDGEAADTDAAAAKDEPKLTVDKAMLRKVIIVVAALVIAGLIGAGMGKLQSNHKGSQPPPPGTSEVQQPSTDDA